MEILYHLKYHDGQLCIHPKGAQEADMAQHHYFDLHKKAYFNKKYIVYKRMLQLAVQTAITQNVLQRKRPLIEYSDDGLLLLLIDSEHPGVEQLGRAITNHGDAYQTSLAWKIEGYVNHEAVVDGTKKPIAVYSLDQDTRKRFSHSQLATPQGLLELEEKLREEFDCNLGDIIVTTIFEFDRYRDPRDIHIYDGNREPRSLLTEDGPRADSLRALADSAFSIRVASTPKLRKEIYQNRKNVKAIVEEAIASSQPVQINLT